MKIGMVCYPTVGGSGVLATELGHELARRGHEVHFITYEIPFRLRLEEENIFFHEVEISQYELFKYPDYALTLAVKIAQVAKNYHLDIVHVHYAIPHAASAYLAKQMLHDKLCVITTLHGTDITLVGTDPSYFEIIKFCIEQSGGVTAVSQALKKQTCSHFGLKHPVEVIYNFFIPKPNLLGSQPLRHLFVQNDEKLLIHSSNYRSVKRPVDVVRIFAKLRAQLACKLLFLGSGPELDAVRGLVDEEGLTNDVFFVGKSREVDPYIASADLFLLPSAQESFGLAALEAMAYGVPVISTNVGGLPELVEDGQNGFLADLGDVDKMAKDALTLLTNNELLRKFGESAKKRAAENFSAEVIVSQYEDYYQKQVGKCK